MDFGPKGKVSLMVQFDLLTTTTTVDTCLPHISSTTTTPLTPATTHMPLLQQQLELMQMSRFMQAQLMAIGNLFLFVS
jgi:hypothetical protein